MGREVSLSGREGSELRWSKSGESGGAWSRDEEGAGPPTNRRKGQQRPLLPQSLRLPVCVGR